MLLELRAASYVLLEVFDQGFDVEGALVLVEQEVLGELVPVRRGLWSDPLLCRERGEALVGGHKGGHLDDMGGLAEAFELLQVPGLLSEYLLQPFLPGRHL